jgi:hypothetical protein
MSINQKVSDDSFFVEVSKLNEFEKFAELIVKACADAADMAQDARCKFAGDYVAEQMGFGQEHGVTEWRTK